MSSNKPENFPEVYENIDPGQLVVITKDGEIRPYHAKESTRYPYNSEGQIVIGIYIGEAREGIGMVQINGIFHPDFVGLSPPGTIMEFPIAKTSSYRLYHKLKKLRDRKNGLTRWTDIVEEIDE